MKRAKNTPEKAPETRGRKSTWEPVVKKVPTGGKKGFENYSQAKGFQRAAKRLDRHPAFRKIQDRIFVFLDQEGY